MSLPDPLPHHRVTFLPESSRAYSQRDAVFRLTEEGKIIDLRFHDYAEIYNRQGLYEQLFYERLQCTSPRKVADILERSVHDAGERLTERRVLDLGAGNGIMAEELKRRGVARMVGADIIPEAREAAFRDRPGAYDAYYVSDFSDLGDEEDDLRAWGFDTLTCVAALGFSDIPVAAFLPAINLVAKGGWLAFNIKDSFLLESDRSGFSRFVRRLILSEDAELHHLERYRHRLSMEGEPLHYYACVMRKLSDRLDHLVDGETAPR